jgi:hypothetical protein
MKQKLPLSGLYSVMSQRSKGMTRRKAFEMERWRFLQIYDKIGFSHAPYLDVRPGRLPVAGTGSGA